MKFLITFFFTFSVLFQLSANDVDSLKTLLQHSNNEEKVEIFNELSIFYWDSNTKESRSFAQKAIEFSKEKGMYNSWIDALINQGVAYEYDAMYDSALFSYTQAKNIAEEQGIVEGKARVYHNLGIFYNKQNEINKSFEFYQKAIKNYSLAEDPKMEIQVLINFASLCESSMKHGQALENYINALELAKKHNDEEFIAEIYNLLGNFYQSISNYETAREYLLNALNIYRNRGDSIGVSIVYNNLGNGYSSIGDDKKALDYYNRVLEIDLANDNINGLATIYNNIATIILDQGRYKDAVKSLKKSIFYGEQLQDKESLLFAHNNLASTYLELNEIDLAEMHLEKSIEILSVLYSKEREKTIYLLEARINSAKQNYKEAYQWYIRYTNLNDSIHDSQNSQKLTEMQIKLETEKKEKEIEILKKDQEIKKIALEKQKTQTDFITIVLVLSFLLIILSLNRYRLKKKANEKLEKANKEIKEFNSQLEKISRTDPLTKLSNRRDMVEKIEYEIHRFERSKKHFVISIADIDDFKKINDTYGHEMGDEVLCTIANIFRSKIRKQDFVSRWGGEEFLFLFPETPLKGAFYVTENLRKIINSITFTCNDVNFKVSLTFGICEYDENTSLKNCLNIADERLYRGKKSGKNCVVNR